ncbi:MAG: hypothetical protein Q8T04_07065 [Bacteroidota bacterium]|nr:hypothetical protein [Bacteroidota bacterium]
MKKTIHIHNILPATIASRKSIGLLSQEINLDSHSSVIFDFADIDFISRAFADELIHFIADNCISAEFKNANSIVNEMLVVVQKNKKKRDSSFHHIAITPFLDQKEFTKFLSMI